MTDADPLRDQVVRYHRRLYGYLRALLPGAGDAEAALETTAVRIGERAGEGAVPEFIRWAEGIARDVAAEHRQSAATRPFSDDLFRQLAVTARPEQDLDSARFRALAEILPQLPPPERELLRRKYELGLTTAEIAASEGRPVAAIVRDLTALHASLVAVIRATVPDLGPEPPGGAGDLGRMADQLLDGTIGDDSRLVLETLLLADTPAQVHYLRHVALACDLTWTFRGPPALPAAPVRRSNPPPISRREWIVTAAFVAACLGTAVFLILLWTDRLG